MTEEEPLKGRQSGRFKDARARSVTLLDPYVLRRLSRHEVIPAEPLAAITKEIGPGLERWPKRALIIGSIVMGLILTVFVVEFVRMTVSGSANLVGWLQQKLPIFIGVGAGLFFAWTAAAKVRARRTCAVMLEHLRCPHCGYDLRLLPVDPEDGATVCPECGCAWKLDKECAVDSRGAAVSDAMSSGCPSSEKADNDG